MHDYATLALRINRHMTASHDGTVLIYDGPEQWRTEVETEASPPSPDRLVAACDALLDQLPFDRARAAYLRAHVRAMRAVAQRLHDDRPLSEYARECLGVEATWQPESAFDAAHAQLDAALPSGAGSVAERLRSWQAAHTLPAAQQAQLPDLVRRAVNETRRRTEMLVPLPDGVSVQVELAPGAHRGHYAGDMRATVYINDGSPFNLADLLYVVAHEGFPGHIAESMLKDIHLAGKEGRIEQRVRFMISPSFVVSEGLGLHAQQIVFPGDEAQRWLSDHILAPLGIAVDGSDFAAIHDARNVLWGAWGNAAFLVDGGRPDAEIAEYLRPWALLSEAETAWALDFLKTPGMDTYVLGYFLGWRLLRRWLDHPERSGRVRRLLTEQLLPSDLEND
ncbi:hypothetical protein G1H10_25885 [Phytoactinopolyspora halotolerans]|uniref:DUF885 domain-containing protein n=1 Tax=Phytoactinopolyspora halotolerans TaxID=1981512 RepID=A0A6L9SGP7_9ACTN|nr:hypothetical protein [Phytoactinopolyspora halotolerans]